ncbi:MAG: nickel-binding protein [Gaiellaceae bacterium]
MLFTAKCFWPGVSDATLEVAVARATGEPETPGAAAFRGALYLPDDELVLCLFEGPSQTAVKRATEQAGFPCERVIDTVWLGPDARGGTTGWGG